MPAQATTLGIHVALTRLMRANSLPYEYTSFLALPVVNEDCADEQRPFKSAKVRLRARRRTFVSTQVHNFNGMATYVLGGAGVVLNLLRGSAVHAPALFGRWTLLAEFRRADLPPLRF